MLGYFLAKSGCNTDVSFKLKGTIAPSPLGRYTILPADFAAEKDFIWVEKAVLSNDKTFVAPEISVREALRRLDCLGSVFQ